MMVLKLFFWGNCQESVITWCKAVDNLLKMILFFHSVKLRVVSNCNLIGIWIFGHSLLGYGHYCVHYDNTFEQKERRAVKLLTRKQENG